MRVGLAGEADTGAVVGGGAASTTFAAGGSRLCIDGAGAALARVPAPAGQARTMVATSGATRPWARLSPGMDRGSEPRATETKSTITAASTWSHASHRMTARIFQTVVVSSGWWPVRVSAISLRCGSWRGSGQPTLVRSSAGMPTTSSAIVADAATARTMSAVRRIRFLLR